MYKKDWFESAYSFTVSHEGKISMNPNDPGGLTKYGISKRAYPNLDIENLTLEQAKEIYFRDYWVRFRCYKISNKTLAIKLFDMCVNMGGYQAVKLFQNCLQKAGHSIVVDGVLGTCTLTAVLRTDSETLVKLLAQENMNFYNMISLRDHRLRVFLPGWMKRASAIPIC